MHEPLLQLTVLFAPSVSVQSELEQLTVDAEPALTVQVLLEQATVAPAPSAAVQVALEHDSVPASPAVTAQVELLHCAWQLSPQRWSQAFVLEQLSPHAPSQRWAQVSDALQLHEEPASVVVHAHEPPSQLTGGSTGAGGLQAARVHSRARAGRVNVCCSIRQGRGRAPGPAATAHV